MRFNERLKSLTKAVELAEGRLDDDLLASVSHVTERAAQRKKKGAHLTVVSLGGATGSGKSSVFNALSGIDLAGVGIRRPTTTWTLACTWGDVDSAPLLEWIGVPERQRLSRRGQLDLPSKFDTMLSGLVLLDMPDHDSFVDRHHEEVAHIVERSDLFVWVLDPQKYADAAIHDQYLRPRAAHQDNTIVLLNQIDRLAGRDREIALADVRQLLDEEGLHNTPLIATSTATGEGISELRELIADRVSKNSAWVERLEIDVKSAAAELEDVTGTIPAPGLQSGDRAKLLESLSVSVGVPQITRAVDVSIARRLRLETGWPFFGWLHRLRKDPLAAVGLLRTPRDVVANTMPMSPTVQAASAELAVRTVTERASDGLPRRWKDEVIDSAGLSESSRHVGPDGVVQRRIIDQLDHGIAEVDLGLDDSAGWVLPWRLGQYLCAAALVIGVLWTLLVVIGMFAPVDVPVAPEVVGVPVPFLVLIVGLLGGILLTVTSTKFAAAVAARRAEQVRERLMAAIAAVVDDSIWPPVQAELDRWDDYRNHLVKAAT